MIVTRGLGSGDTPLVTAGWGRRVAQEVQETLATVSYTLVAAVREWTATPAGRPWSVFAATRRWVARSRIVVLVVNRLVRYWRVR